MEELHRGAAYLGTPGKYDYSPPRTDQASGSSRGKRGPQNTGWFNRCKLLLEAYNGHNWDALTELCDQYAALPYTNSQWYPRARQLMECVEQKNWGNLYSLAYKFGNLNEMWHTLNVRAERRAHK